MKLNVIVKDLMQEEDIIIKNSQVGTLIDTIIDMLKKEKQQDNNC
ncbi:hypothetical protein [Clostridium niameyense]|nr:hypothetical protein [Clostridium niameyense]